MHHKPANALSPKEPHALAYIYTHKDFVTVGMLLKHPTMLAEAEEWIASASINE